MSDELTWVIQAQQGDEAAFTKLVEKFQKPVYNLCYRMLGDSKAAEDAAQETFLKVYQTLTRYDRSRSFATWMLSISAHYCIDKLRTRRLSFFIFDEDEEWQAGFTDHSASDPEAETARRQERERLHNCLKFLDPTSRAAVILRYWQDCSEAEIAQALNLTVPAVKSRLHRARQALAKLWEEIPIHMQTEMERYGFPADPHYVRRIYSQ